MKQPLRTVKHACEGIDSPAVAARNGGSQRERLGAVCHGRRRCSAADRPPVGLWIHHRAEHTRCRRRHVAGKLVGIDSAEGAQHHLPHGIQICARVTFPAPSLGGHERLRPAHLDGRCDPLFQHRAHRRDAEVDDHRMAESVDQHVRGLEIAVHDAGPVQTLQRIQEHEHGGSERGPHARRWNAGKWLAVDVLHGEPNMTVALPLIEETHDAGRELRPLNPHEGCYLQPRAGQRGVAAHTDPLDGDQASGQLIDGGVDVRRAATGKRFHNPISIGDTISAQQLVVPDLLVRGDHSTTARRKGPDGHGEASERRHHPHQVVEHRGGERRSRCRGV